MSSVELVHCEGVELTLLGPTPVVQIDLSRDVLVLFGDEQSRPKIVHASNQSLWCGRRGAPEREQL